MVRVWSRLAFALALAGVSLVLAWATIILIAAASRPIAHAAPLCVKPGGGGGCFSSISAALTGAQNGDVIRVAAGTYTENVVITRSVTVEGGWDSTFSARNPAANVTTIRPANLSQAVVTIQGTYGNGAALTPMLDGFTITGARSDNHGGGIRMNDSNAIIKNNIITDNVGFLLGGGVWVQRGAPRFENNRIENNRSDGLGQ